MAIIRKNHGCTAGRASPADDAPHLLSGFASPGARRISAHAASLSLDETRKHHVCYLLDQPRCTFAQSGYSLFDLRPRAQRSDNMPEELILDTNSLRWYHFDDPEDPELSVLAHDFSLHRLC